MTKTKTKKEALEDRLGAVLGRSWLVLGRLLGSFLLFFHWFLKLFVKNQFFQKCRFLRGPTFSNVFSPKSTPRRGRDRPKIAPRQHQDGLEELLFRCRNLSSILVRFGCRFGAILGPFWHPFWNQNRSKNRPEIPRSPQEPPRASQEPPRAAKRHPRRAKRHPKGTQEHPKGTQKAPKSTQKAPKRAKRAKRAQKTKRTRRKRRKRTERRERREPNEQSKY